jgi:hypothetical protein
MNTNCPIVTLVALQVNPSQDDDHWNITANPLEFHYTDAYTQLLNSLPGAASSEYFVARVHPLPVCSLEHCWLSCYSVCQRLAVLAKGCVSRSQRTAIRFPLTLRGRSLFGNARRPRPLHCGDLVEQ